jgi:hypothetical protein
MSSPTSVQLGHRGASRRRALTAPIGTRCDKELDDVCAKLSAGRTFGVDTLKGLIPAIGFTAGRQGRRQPRSMSPSTSAFVARSLALRCAGLTATQADEQVADENPGVRNRWTVAVYRHRFRDRLRWATPSMPRSVRRRAPRRSG